MNNLKGKIINGRYKIDEIVGVGGMAVVYKAFDMIHNEVVAVKVLKQEFLADPQFRKRFETESEIIKMLDHENIVKIYNVGFNDDLYYIVMEYIDGITLKKYIEQEGKLNWTETLHFTIQVLKALSHAHSKGIIHKDIKPQNIMILQNGQIKVTDFGIAKMSNVNTATMTDKAIGSVHYISPEQVNGNPVDERSDLYSVGIMMYEMLTGRVPFDADNPVSVALMHLKNTPVQLNKISDEIPYGLDDIIMRAIAKNPFNRHPSADIFLQDIERFKQDPSIRFFYKYLDEDNPEKIKKVIDEVKSVKHNRKMSKTSIGAITGIIAAFVLIVAFVIIPFVLKDAETESKEVEVPKLVGVAIDEIENSSKYKDFRIITVASNYNDEYEKGLVYKQEPKEGKIVMKNSDIRVYVSLGKELVTVPYLINSSKIQATISLNKLNLNFEFVYEDNDEVILDYVIRTEPKAYTELEKNETVIVYISKGKQESFTEVPNLIGKKVDEAKALLDELKIKYTVVTVPSPKPVNEVVGQSKEQYSQISSNDYLEIQVSDGKNILAKKIITIKLPEADGDYIVRITQNDIEVYNNKHNPSEQQLQVELTGKGAQTVCIYVDDILIDTRTVEFN